MKETLEAIYKTYFDYYYSLQSQFLQSFGLYTQIIACPGQRTNWAWHSRIWVLPFGKSAQFNWCVTGFRNLTKISHLCWSNVLYSFWALWWWVYLQGCLRTQFYHPINVGFMRGKHLGGFKRHFIESKVLPRLRMAASHALQLLPIFLLDKKDYCIFEGRISQDILSNSE